MKSKETLEEAAEKSFGEIWSTLTPEQSKYLKGYIDRQIKDAKKWQQERSYSEQEMLPIIEYIQWVLRKIDAGDTPEEIVKLLLFEKNKIEQFKKK